MNIIRSNIIFRSAERKKYKRQTHRRIPIYRIAPNLLIYFRFSLVYKKSH